MANVTFQESGLTLAWTGEHESILELAESNGLDLDYGCRMGNCTACQQALISGEIEYTDEPGGTPDEGKILICCSTPRTDIVVGA